MPDVQDRLTKIKLPETILWNTICTATIYKHGIADNTRCVTFQSCWTQSTTDVHPFLMVYT